MVGFAQRCDQTVLMKRKQGSISDNQEENFITCYTRYFPEKCVLRSSPWSSLLHGQYEDKSGKRNFTGMGK